MNIGISNWYNWSFHHTKIMFLTLFQFLTRLLTSKNLKLFCTYLVGEMERCEKRAFQLLKMRKNDISWNIKTKCVTDIYWQLHLRVWRIIFFITCWAHKRQIFALISIIIMRIWKFFLQVTEYLNIRESCPIYMFVVMSSVKCDLHLHFTFLQEF